MVKKIWDDIPLDRNDNECPNCGGGRLKGKDGFRQTDKNHYQLLWECYECGFYPIVSLDEERNQQCPTCGQEGALGISEIKEIRTYISEQTLHDIKRLLEEGVDDFWWTLEQDGNFSLINRLRKIVCLDELSSSYREECYKYYQNS